MRHYIKSHELSSLYYRYHFLNNRKMKYDKFPDITNKFNCTVCFCHATHAFQSESTLFSCMNVNELLARSRRKIWRWSDCNWTRTQNHLVLKRTLTHLAKLVKCTVQINTQNTAQSFGQFGQMVECPCKNEVVLDSSPVAVT